MLRAAFHMKFVGPCPSREQCFLTGEILPDGEEKKFKNANFGKKIQNLIFLSPIFSSNVKIFHPFEQIFIKL
jgi:hypothetical protein